MEQRNSKSINGNVFKRLKTTNKNKIAYEGGEDFMKKILSVFVAIAMLFSLVAPFSVQTAKAFPTGSTGIVLTTSNFSSTYSTSKLGQYTGDPKTDSYWILNEFSHFNPIPDYHAVGTVVQDNDPITPSMKYEVYKMGDIIYGKVVNADGTPWVPVASTWQALLVKWNGGTTYEVVDAQTEFTGTNRFTLGTGNVALDGEYYILIYSGTSYVTGNAIDISSVAPAFKESVYIVYNIAFSAQTISSCPGTATVSGFITRGNYMSVLETVNVAITVPCTYGIYKQAEYNVAAGSSGQFTLTFPTTCDLGDTEAAIGKWYIFVTDSYNGHDGYDYDPGTGTLYSVDTNGAIIYYYISNIPSTSISLSTYINPTLIYKDTNNQPLLLRVLDNNQQPVTNIPFADWTITNATVLSYLEIAPGFYRFEINVGSVPDVRFKAKKVIYGLTLPTNVIAITTRERTAFNPYIDFAAVPGAVTPYVGQSVYDYLPCTIGTSVLIRVGYYPVKDPANWYIEEGYSKVSGPVRKIQSAVVVTWPGIGNNPNVTYSYNRYLITKAGKISVNFSDFVVWERVNKTCQKWDTETITEEEMSQNACCHTDYTKAFDLCEVASCTVDKVSLENGAQKDETSIEIMKGADLILSIGTAGKPNDLECGCNSKVVWMYMVDSYGNKMPNAFTMNIYGGGTKTVTEIWWNPTNANSTGGGTIGAAGNPAPLWYQPITFKASDPSLLITDNCSTLTFSGLKFNYPNTTDCAYKLVVKVFGQQRTYKCGVMALTYPMIADLINPISIDPVTTEISGTPTVIEGNLDPKEILAGVPSIVEFSVSPAFSTTSDWNDVEWSVWLNEIDANEYNLAAASVASVGDKYRTTFSCPLGDVDGYGNPLEKIIIYGYHYSLDYCRRLEEVVIEVPVVMPTFTIKIGLMDGSVIDNDGILTAGFKEKVYVDVKDPREGSPHDFTTDTNWNLEAEAVLNDCYLPTSKVCWWPPIEGCTTPSPITVLGYDNPNINDDPEVDIWFKSYGCAEIKVTTLKFVDPNISVDPKEVEVGPGASPAKQHVIFKVEDAHKHLVPDMPVEIDNVAGLVAGGFVGITMVTGKNGEVDFTVPSSLPSGKYYVSTSTDESCPLPCGWLGVNTTATFEAVYKAPVVDTTVPTVTVTAPAEVTTSTVKITGKATDNVGVVAVWIGAKQASLAPDGTFEAVLDLAVGDNTFTVSAYDAANNVGTAKVTVKYVVPQVTKIVLKIGSDIMMVNDKAVQLDAAAEIKNGRTFLPLRAIAEAFGATVTWVPETQGITVVLGDTQIGLQIDNDTAVVNGNVISIEKPYIKNSRTMVPFRVISEAFGADVQWDPINYIVTVTLQG